MKKDKVLIITNEKDDAHADFFIQKCNELGLGDKVVRLNTEKFSENCTIKFDIENYKILIKDSERTLNTDEILSVWYRRPMPIMVDKYSDEGVKKFIQNQSIATLRGLYFLLHGSAKWVNPLPAMHAARHKLPQLVLAKSIGFKVPETLVTNNPHDAVLFFKRFGVLCNKSLDEPNYTIDGNIYPYLTRKIVDVHQIIDNDSSIRICPTLFQEYIEKKADIRVVVVEEHVTAVEIESQSNKYSKIDFRGVSPHLLQHKKHKLPDSIEKMILSFTQKSGLRFSAMDLVIDKRGEYYFIENNCNGQWLWLDQLAKTDILNQMISCLFRP